jgi:hypothetical protein
MNRYGLIKNNEISLIVESPTKPDGWVSVGNSNVGDKEISQGVFAPKTVIEPPIFRRITKYAFLTRFTDEEAIMIDLASIGNTVEAASLRRYMNKINAASYIDLNDTITRTGVTSLESVGLLATGRALEILDDPIQPQEVA